MDVMFLMLVANGCVMIGIMPVEIGCSQNETPVVDNATINLNMNAEECSSGF